MDESAVTGEPLPVERGPGDEVIAGTITSDFFGISRALSAKYNASVPLAQPTENFDLVNFEKLTCKVETLQNIFKSYKIKDTKSKSIGF